MIRRLQERCDSFKYHLSVNSTGDQCVTAIRCNKPVQIKREAVQYDSEGFPTGQVYQVLACGHSRLIDIEEKVKREQRNVLWDNLFGFQKRVIERIEENNLQGLINTRMGSGKTIMAASLLRENAAEFTANFTKYCVIVTPVGGIYQWKEELEKFLGLNNIQSIQHAMLTPQVIYSPKQTLTPVSKVVIVPWTKLSEKNIQKQLFSGGVASMIVDESHFFKNLNSARTQALIDVSKKMPLNAPKVFLSGTPVENNVFELAVVLNQLDPRYFSSWLVIDRMCLHDSRGKAISLAPYWRQTFFDRTKNYIIRIPDEEMDIPLPPSKHEVVWADARDFEVNEEFVKAYNTTLSELETILYGAKRDAGSIIGLMQQLRHHVGRMKIMSLATWIDAWMTMNPGEKICVGIHHIFVREALCKLLAHRRPLSMSDESPEKKDEIERKFRNGYSNLLIANVISAGVGRNMQFCRNAILMERQWNPSKEAQFFGRFHRPLTDEYGRVRYSFTEEDTVRFWTMNLRNSYDEFMVSMNELKKVIVDSTEEDEDIPPMDSIFELAEKVVSLRMKWVA